MDVLMWLRARQDREAKQSHLVSGSGEGAELYGRAADEIEAARAYVEIAKAAFSHALNIGAPGLSLSVREAIVRNAMVRMQAKLGDGGSELVRDLTK